MVTFGHHFENGGQKNGKKESKKYPKSFLISPLGVDPESNSKIF
jgi:hypothetical protein